MDKKLRIGVVGLGKMGLSHFALVNPHPLTETIACDATGYLIDVLGKYIPNQTYKNYDKMIAEGNLDAVVIATPSRLHEPMVLQALEHGLHVFCEKPFCLDWQVSEDLAKLAREKGVVNQVGYHYRHVGAFQEMQRCLAAGLIGNVSHVLAEAYGPVVLKPKRATWRTQKTEGGGCLYDYAAHPLNLVNWFFGAPERARGTVMRKIFSADTEDEVYATLDYQNGPSVQLSVNWSDESYRKMSTKVTAWGSNGRIYADRQEIQVYLRSIPENGRGYSQGWNVRYTTELTQESWFYLRGEEYSNQIDAFITAAATGSRNGLVNDFESAAMTDKTIAMLIADQSGKTLNTSAEAASAHKKQTWFARR